MKSDARAYDNTGRQAVAAQTRHRILDCAAGLLARDGFAAFTVEGVAGEAGVSPRTIYRYFDSREQMLDALWQRMNEQFGLHDYPTTAEGLRAAPRRVFEKLDAQSDLVRVYLATEQIQRRRLEEQVIRRKAINSAIREAAAAADPEEAKKVADVIGVLFSLSSWRLLKDRSGLSGAEAGERVTWAIDILLDHLRHRSPAVSADAS